MAKPKMVKCRIIRGTWVYGKVANVGEVFTVKHADFLVMLGQKQAVFIEDVVEKPSPVEKPNARKTLADSAGNAVTTR
jgi:hypothetical protein